MRNLRAPSVIVAVCVAVTLAGCAGTQSGSSYSAHQARGELLVRIGVVDSVRQVTIEGEKSPVGVLTGGVVGGIVGSNIGGGNRGSAVGSILGAVAGGAGGNALEQQLSKKAGLEITIKFESGQMIAVTQEADEQFHPGERVRVLSGQGSTRVSH